MSGSTFGNIFRVTTWGESHGEAIGVVIDGCPSGLSLCNEDINESLRRRRPGEGEFSSPRKEEDSARILSGVFEGKTIGTPISIIIENMDADSAAYAALKEVYRPSHADYVYEQKYGIRDYRGGGRSSGRETAARVAAGAVAKKILQQKGIEINAYTLSIGNVSVDRSRLNPAQAEQNNLRMPDAAAYNEAVDLLRKTKAEKDSLGGIVECIIKNLPPGIGDPVFDKLDAQLAYGIMSIGGVKGIEFGCGFGAAGMPGSAHNDSLYADESGTVRKTTNHSGGVTGGLSDGSDIVFRAAIKPTPTIGKKQNTVSRSGKSVILEAAGRHDVAMVPRIVPVVEAMAAMVLADYYCVDSKYV